MLAVPERVKKTLAIITQAAERGEICPTNAVLCQRIGGMSLSAGSDAVALLETMGLIRVRRGPSTRVVTIVATGKKTAGIAKGVHSSELRGASRAKPRGRRVYNSAWDGADDALLMERVSLGDDFHQAGLYIGAGADRCAARFDELRAGMGWQAA